MKIKFDLVVIGTGTAASSAASRCKKAGWSVAVVDSRPFGGTCALRGCDPKKVLVGVAEVLDGARRMEGKGVRPGDAAGDWARLMAYKRQVIANVPANKEKSFAESGIVSFHGRARFVGPTTLQVGDETLEGRRVLIASGAVPAKLGIPGEEHLVASDAFLELETLPREIIFVGGGYISFEFAHVAARFGSTARILHRAPRPLEGFDPDLVDELVRTSRDVGIGVELDTAVASIEKRGDRFIVRAIQGEARAAFEVDLVVHGAGRAPEIDDLDLEKAGIAREKTGVTVNEFLQSASNPAVYAAGDAAATDAPRLTPVSSMHGKVVAANLLEGNHARPDVSYVASVAFTIPAIARVGLLVSEAEKRGLRARVHREDTSSWYSSRRLNVGRSGSKVLVDEGTGLILGAHVFGPYAEELINLFAMAMQAGVSAEKLKEMTFAYPTGASDVGYML